MDAILYTRDGCHLCEHARKVLEDHGVSVTPIDIDEHPEHRARFDYCIPVVEIEGKIRFRGRVHPVLLRRFLANRAKSP
jgi:glutaredoxin